jgi:N-carbamoylputrescine amidase
MPHWQRTMQGHSAANIVPVVTSNRTGLENIEGNSPTGITQNSGSEITFYGSSFITNHIGEKISESPRDKDNDILLANFDLEQIHLFRRSWGIFRDRRPPLYYPLLTNDGTTQ